MILRSKPKWAHKSEHGALTLPSIQLGGSRIVRSHAQHSAITPFHHPYLAIQMRRKRVHGKRLAQVVR